MKTYSTKPKDVTRDWLLVDAEGIPLGRLASAVAALLRGKHKPIFAPHVDTGDFVVIVNAARVRFTGKKAEQKIYYSHSGYLGGLKQQGLKKILEAKPEFPVAHAVKGMLPHNHLGRAMLKKLKVYAGPDHPHEAQNPRPVKLNLDKGVVE